MKSRRLPDSSRPGGFVAWEPWVGAGFPVWETFPKAGGESCA